VVNLIQKSNSNTAKTFEGKIDTVISIGNTIARESRERILFKGLKKIKNQNIQYFVLKSHKNVFLFPAVPKVNSWEDCFLTQTLFGSGFYYETWNAKFPSDNYEIWLIEKDNQNNFIPLFCRKEIQL
jgi:hypothetical protein